jgi:hypothetical protein
MGLLLESFLIRALTSRPLDLISVREVYGLNPVSLQDSHKLDVEDVIPSCTAWTLA